ncbi:hypothetical protein HYDPIDRAFT_108166, partial [Hydnomerulius pinastri MD-312]
LRGPSRRHEAHSGHHWHRRRDVDEKEESSRILHYRSRSRSPRRPHIHSRSRSGPRRRSRSRSRDEDKHRSKKERRKRSRSRSSISSSDSDSSFDRKRHKKKHRTREEKERRRKEKKENMKMKHTAGSSSAPWGKYGIISDSETWLLEERKLNPEALSMDLEHKEFSVFTHMEAYERRIAFLWSGEFVPPPDGGYDPAADMKAYATSETQEVRVEQESYMSLEQSLELRKVQHERIEIGRAKRLGVE